MKTSFEGVLYILGGIIRLLDFGTDWYYVFSQEFEAEWLRLASMGVLVAPSAIFILIMTFLAVIDLCRGNCRPCCIKFCVGLLMAVVDPLGLSLCIFGCVLISSNTKKFDFYAIEALTRASGLIEGMFESLPQMIIQAYNNHTTGQWDPFTITSLGLSTGGFIYCCIKLVYAMDKMSHYETVHIEKQKTIHSAMRIEEAVKKNELQVYDLEEHAAGYFNNVSHD